MPSFTSFPIPTLTTTQWGLPVSVKDPLYGATGNGVTDDTAAIQAAFAAAAGNAVLFPPGTYLISDSIVPQSGTTVIGDNATIQCPTIGWDTTLGISHLGFFSLVGVSDIRISNLHFYGTKTQPTNRTPKFIFMDTCNRIWICCNFFENKNFEGIWPDNPAGSNYVYIINNRFNDVAVGALLPCIQAQFNNSIVSGNVITNCGIGIGCNGDGNVIANNQISGVAAGAAGGITVDADGNYATNIIVIGNSIEITNNTRGIFAQSSGTDGAYIVDNYISLNSTNPAITLTGILLSAVPGFVARGNFIHCSGTASLLGIVGLGGANAPAYIIDGNIVFFENNIGGTLNEGVEIIPNGGGNTVSAYVTNNQVIGVLSGSLAYDFTNAGGGTTTTMILGNNVKTNGQIRVPSGTIVANNTVDNGRPYTYSTTQKVTAFVDELSAAFLPATTVAGLPASPTAGAAAYVTDGTAALAWGATVTGGASTKYLVWFNGAAWTVVGK